MSSLTCRSDQRTSRWPCESRRHLWNHIRRLRRRFDFHRSPTFLRYGIGRSCRWNDVPRPQL